MIKVVARLVTLLYAILLTIALVNPAAPRLVAKYAPDNPWVLMFQNNVHFWTMAGLATLVLFSRFPLRFSWTIAALIAYAVVTELTHLLLKERAFEWSDLGQNLAGVTSVILLYVSFAGLVPRLSRSQIRGLH